jgi:hypothetical protein
MLGNDLNSTQKRHSTVIYSPSKRYNATNSNNERLIANNIRCRRRAKEPLLTIRHRQERLESTMQRQSWRHQRWRNIIFSDESRYSIFNADGRPRVCRKRGKRLSVACSMERDSWGRPNIRAWCGIGLYFKLGNVIFQNIGTCRLRSLAT